MDEKQKAYEAWRNAKPYSDEKEKLWWEWFYLEPSEFDRHCRISRNNGLSEPQPLCFG